MKQAVITEIFSILALIAKRTGTEYNRSMTSGPLSGEEALKLKG